MDGSSVGALIPIAAIAAWAAVKIVSAQANARAIGSDPQVTRRLDFAERLLTQRRSDRIEGPS